MIPAKCWVRVTLCLLVRPSNTSVGEMWVWSITTLPCVCHKFHMDCSRTETKSRWQEVAALQLRSCVCFYSKNQKDVLHVVKKKMRIRKDTWKIICSIELKRTFVFTQHLKPVSNKRFCPSLHTHIHEYSIVLTSTLKLTTLWVLYMPTCTIHSHVKTINKVKSDCIITQILLYVKLLSIYSFLLWSDKSVLQSSSWNAPLPTTISVHHFVLTMTH